MTWKGALLVGVAASIAVNGCEAQTETKDATELSTEVHSERESKEESHMIQAADPFGLEAGDCFDDTAMGINEVTEVPEVPCLLPHDNEVYALFELPPGDFPGDEEVEASATLGCYERFSEAIGKSYEESELDFLAMHPTEASWTQINDREVVCLAYHMEYQKLTGSVLGSGR
mgnify:CR=1 FL=1|tara:strand:- start:2759 stop:3277 length:519 start_codon:yes stop_codon:yes gene_type:complete